MVQNKLQIIPAVTCIVFLTLSSREGIYSQKLSAAGWKRHSLGISDEEQLGAVACDINADGYPDLVVARFWFENPGADQFPDSAWTRHTYAGGLPRENHDIAACDFDNDGRKEILFYSQSEAAGTLRLFNTANADIWSYYDVAANVNETAGNLNGGNGVHGGFAPSGIGDLNGDLFADIVMPAGWYRNPGSGDSIWLYQAWPFRTGIVPNLYGISIRSWVADLDSDGDNDIVYADCDVEGSKGFWIRNKRNGHKFEQNLLPSPGDPTGSFHSLAVADFDIDGDLDIFTGEQEDPDPLMKPAGLKERGFFWENTGKKGKPGFRVRVIHTDNPGWHDVQAGDADGDGDTDLASKVWNKDDAFYHADYWENPAVTNRKKKR
jgi:hypothetical protein